MLSRLRRVTDLRQRTARIAVLLACLVAVGFSSDPALATSFKPVFLEVTSIEVTVVVDADPESDGLVEGAEIANRVATFLSAQLRDKRPEIEVRPVQRHGPMPERAKVERGTLAVVLSLSVRTKIQGSPELSCCFGALELRLDRDFPRRGPIDEFVVTEDDYRMIWPPEPLFLGDKKMTAGSRAVEASEKLLQPLVNVLNEISPRRP